MTGLVRIGIHSWGSGYVLTAPSRYGRVSVPMTSFSLSAHDLTADHGSHGYWPNAWASIDGADPAVILGDTMGEVKGQSAATSLPVSTTVSHSVLNMWRGW